MRTTLGPRPLGPGMLSATVGALACLLGPALAPAQAQFGGMAAQIQSQSQPQADDATSGGAAVGGGFPAVQFVPVRPRAPHPLRPAAAETWLALQQPVKFSFAKETPLEDVLKFLAEAVVPAAKDRKPDAKDQAARKPLQFYLDPVGLQEAEKTQTSPVMLDLGPIPAATGLGMVLKSLGLGFSVQKDGVVAITNESPEALTADHVPVSAEAARTWIALHRPGSIAVSDAPLDEVLKGLRQATGFDRPKGLPLYVDPVALREGGQTMSSKVTLQLDDVPLYSVLELVASQVGLVYRVREDGIVIFKAEEEDEADLPDGHGGETIARLKAMVEEAKLAAEIARYRALAANPQGGVGGPAAVGAAGGGFRSVRPR